LPVCRATPIETRSKFPKRHVHNKVDTDAMDDTIGKVKAGQRQGVTKGYYSVSLMPCFSSPPIFLNVIPFYGDGSDQFTFVRRSLSAGGQRTLKG